MSADMPVAVVTGGAAGIGAAIAHRLTTDGFHVVVADRDVEAARAFAAGLGAGGASAIGVDVSDPVDVTSMYAWIRAEFGRCDAVVNNAGIATLAPFAEFPLDRWSAMLAVNLTGAMLVAQGAVPLMRERAHGRIVNISSVSGMRASRGRTAYGTTKTALLGLTRQMAIELAEDGITVNAVAPGPVDTQLSAGAHSDETRRSYARAIPMRRYGTPSEIAAAVSFLCSADAGYITGHAIPVDGGYMAAGVLDI